MKVFSDKIKWRKWLEKNHNKSEGIWIIFYKKNSGKKSVSYKEAVEEALCFGWIDSTVRGIDGEKYCQRYTPRRKNSVWSKINKKNALRLIKEKRMAPAGFAIIREAKKSGSWKQAYGSIGKEKIEIPEELKKALLKEHAWTNFNSFGPSYRNLYIHWYLDAKTEKTRLKRRDIIVRNSLLNKRQNYS